MTHRPYSAGLAAIHHEGFGFTARNAAAELLHALKSAGYRSGTVVDLGCGSGILSQAVAEAGFDVFGVDLSEDMLRLARTTVPSGRFVRASLLDVELPACVAVAAVGEIFSYAFDARASLESFERAAGTIFRALRPGGVFLFDVAGPGRAGPEPRTGFVDEAGWSIVHRTVEAGDSLTRDITTFMRDGDTYRRSDERHVLRLYRPEDISAALQRAGFRVTRLKGYGEFTLPAGWHPFLALKPRV